MNYKRIYDQLIERARNRVLSSYKERHHIVPRCMGGTDEISNLVDLTAEEHFVAHQLLVKIYPGVPGLIYACIAMTGETHEGRAGNKAYGWIRRAVSEQRKGTKASPETRKKLSEDRKRRGVRPPDPTGRKHTEKAKVNMSEAQKGRVVTEEHRRKISESHKGMTYSEETKKKLSELRKGVSKSEAHRKAIGEAQRGRKHTPERIANMVEGRRLAKLKREQGRS